MGKITFDSDLCKGCGLCVEACPKGLIFINTGILNRKGYHPAATAEDAPCIGCAFCAMMCPDCVIKVEK